MKHNRLEYVIQIVKSNPPQYLCKTNMDWAIYLPSEDIFNAIRFNSKIEALEYIEYYLRDSGWNFICSSVYVTIEAPSYDDVIQQDFANGFTKGLDR